MFDEYRCFVEELKRELMQATGKPEACFEFQERGDSGDVLTIVNRPSVPATGDGASPALWALLAMAVLLCAAMLRKASRA